MNYYKKCKLIGAHLLTLLLVPKYNRDFTLENTYSVILCNTANVLQTHFHFYGTQIIDPFCDSMISINHHEIEGI